MTEQPTHGRDHGAAHRHAGDHDPEHDPTQDHGHGPEHDHDHDHDRRPGERDGERDGSAGGSHVDAGELFEAPAWDERYDGAGQVWSGDPNPQLVAEASRLTPGTALDVGCGEGGDVIWLARQGWRATGADFSANGLARAARHAEQAGVADRTDWWLVDARRLAAEGRAYDLVTTHFLHPADDGMGDVVRRLADAVSPGGHLLVVGHAPSAALTGMAESHRHALFRAADLVPALPDDFEVLVAEERPRVATRDGVSLPVEDATLLARRTR